ncbi:TPA: hypothetical protein DDX46_04665 [Candidatus Saccharibacteria bacterium]|nr:MAG: hypothetical protein UW38_C0001G1083 [Candidatus Saccharibacteria bacterium GW2011_GWC2_44_17]OGL34187.1 MAG: hypothetical protein A3E20_04770 [Candidatus Saccharibacteria bacterium RIFCSPHIGHO2_12_FULL_47_16]HBH78008.1 hypothetical protein [Candidatus Saccharibacteria bacterium]
MTNYVAPSFETLSERVLKGPLHSGDGIAVSGYNVPNSHIASAYEDPMIKCFNLDEDAIADLYEQNGGIPFA